MDYTGRIKEFIITEFIPDIVAGQLAADYDLIASGVIDSLSLLRVIAWLATEFGIPVDEIDISEQNFVSVTAINELVVSATNSQFAVRS